jgi:hypothetical protein
MIDTIKLPHVLKQRCYVQVTKRDWIFLPRRKKECIGNGSGVGSSDIRHLHLKTTGLMDNFYGLQGRGLTQNQQTVLGNKYQLLSLYSLRKVQALRGCIRSGI